MKIDMHCHTKEGSLDGKVPIETYIRLLQEQGIHGMLVSDHNSYNGYRYWKNHRDKMPPDFVVLKGIEYDTIDAGHILVILPTGVKVPLIELRGMPVNVLIDIVHRHGGILGPAHPCGERFLSLTNNRRFRKQKSMLEKFDFVETFNSCEPESSNEGALMLAQAYGRQRFPPPGLCGNGLYLFFPGHPLGNGSDQLYSVRKFHIHRRLLLPWHHPRKNWQNESGAGFFLLVLQQRV